MADGTAIDPHNNSDESGPSPLATQPEAAAVEAGQFTAATGEDIASTLDLDTWESGDDLTGMYDRLNEEVREAVRQEDDFRRRIRKYVFPRLPSRAGAPKGAGVHSTTTEELERVHRGLLFRGAVEACDGVSVVHDTLPLTITQLGVCLASYRGDMNSWVHRLYRRDIRMRGGDPVDATMRLLENRRQRAGYDIESERDTLSTLARRGIMTYAERAVLLKKSDAPWRMGHGNPAPYELVTGSGSSELLGMSLDLLEELVFDHQRFVFVPSAPSDRVLLTIANALHPLEYAIVDTMTDQLGRIVEGGHYRGSSWAPLEPRVKDFARRAGEAIVVGLYRASQIAPAQVFYAHADHAHKAAHIVMADSVIQGYRGFPMLIDLADTVCSTAFGVETLMASTQVAYTDAGAPYRYSTERQTRG